MQEEFRRDCEIICSNGETLCDIVLDLCYTKSATKKFAWLICGGEIIHSLLKKNDYTIQVPILDSDGEIEFGGSKFSIISKRLEGYE